MTSFSKEFFNDRWHQAAIPMKMRGNRLADYEPVLSVHTGLVHPETTKSIQTAQSFVDTFATEHYISEARARAGKFPSDRSKLGKGLLLSGPNGTRKTTLACAVATEVQYLSPSLRTYYIRFKDLKDTITATFNDTDYTETARKILNIVRLVPLLILDDVGQEYRTTSGFTEKEFHELLRIRYESSRPTIVTTNITPDNMESVYGKSFESFRHDAFDLLRILGQDSRKA